MSVIYSACTPNYVQHAPGFATGNRSLPGHVEIWADERGRTTQVTLGVPWDAHDIEGYRTLSGGGNEPGWVVMVDEQQ